MKLYQEENKNMIFETQTKDPFFNYVSSILFSYLDKGTGRILDLGCGSGNNLIKAAKMGYQVVGIDIERISIEITKDFVETQGLTYNTKLICADITKLKPKQYGLFDYVIMQEVIEHVIDYQKLIDFAYSSLKSGGKILITTPNDPGQWSIIDDYAGHVRRFRITELSNCLKDYTDKHIFTIGFPLHRIIITLYSALLNKIHKQHVAGNFRKNILIKSIYYFIKFIIVRVDCVFNFTSYGTTIIAIGTK